MTTGTATDQSQPRAAFPGDADIRRAVIDKRLAVEEEMRDCERILENFRRRNPNKTLAEVLLEYNYVTVSQLKRVAAELSRPEVDRPGGIPQQIPGYQVMSKLGQGAMAIVYKAKQISLDRIVAIKVLPRRLSQNAEFVERFYKEGKAAARLNHENIVQAFDVGQEPGGLHYFVMEFVEGVTVFDELEKSGPYEEKEALRLCIHVAKALEHSHEIGFIHRDVKPKNIMVTPQRIAKLADMGLARQADDVESARQEMGRAYGTPYYIAPEQIRGQVDIDFRADIYSLGATLYHMVTGRVPFEGSTPTEVMRRHLKDPLVPPDHIVQNLSTGIGEVIEMMMRKKKEERYASTKELLMDLEAISTGGPPVIAQRNFNLSELESIAQPGIGESGHAVSLNVLHAQYGRELVAVRKYMWIATGVAGVLALWHIVNLIRFLLAK